MDKNRAYSLSAKVITVLELALLIFGLALGIVGLVAFTEAFKTEYASSSLNMARKAASFIDGNKLDEYLDDTFKEEHNNIQKSFDDYCLRMDISFLYVITPDAKDPEVYYAVFPSVNNGVDNSKY